jgi:uncharacterized protein DUF6228
MPGERHRRVWHHQPVIPRSPVLVIGAESSLQVEPIDRDAGVAVGVRLSLREGEEMSATIPRAVLNPDFREAEKLVEFLEELGSMHWTGWTGTRSWSNADHNLAIEAMWHLTGYATLRVTLRPEGERWQARGTLEVDNVSVERLGPDARAVLMGADP